MTIYISLPVHEQPPVVIDQAMNLLHYCPSSVVVIHVSAGFDGNSDEVVRWAQPQQRVVINPQRLDTRWGDILNVHASNLEGICARADDEDRVCFHSSNDLFVRHGVDQYLRQLDATFFFAKVHPFDWDHPAAKSLAADRPTMDIFESRGIRQFHWSQIEGSSYPVGILRQILGELRCFAEAGPDHEYFTEEIVLPTLAHDELKRQRRTQFGYPYVFSQIVMFAKHRNIINRVVPWARLQRVAFKCTRKGGLGLINRRMVDRIRRGNSKVIAFYEICGGTRRYVREHLYGVKRVGRQVNDPVRAYIRETW